MVRFRSAATRERRIARALALLEARFGPGVVHHLSAARPASTQRAISSGSLGLDLATGGGFPRGQLTEIFGPPSSGKTALLYSALAAAQRADGLVALIDAEGSVDAEALQACGVNLDTLLLAQPASTADALLLLTILTRCGGLDALGLLSIAGLLELLPDRDTISDERIARRDLARLLTRGLRVLTTSLGDSPTAVLVTNELLPGWRDTYRTIGGLALRHFAALRIAVEPRQPLFDDRGGILGLAAGLTVVKHKLGRPGGHAQVNLLLARGLDRPTELLTLGLATGSIERHPLGLLFGADLLGRSQRSAARRLTAEPALAARLEAAIVASYARPTAA